ncbi:hypothetical protein ABEB36_009969 [Hypothenemus hampei]|uniref:Uncharacterized protein n=1 Tax=Hypothenemus hampei TaxID=57062 RepID=A0ABD1EI29_HYPHA
MGDARFEEKSPLLLYMVDGEENNPCKSNHKTVNLEKGRLHGISSGATTVFTQFPNYFSPCWITTMLSAIIFLMMLLLMLPSMVPVPKTNLRIPRCIHENNKEILSNQTIHLVHSSGNWTDEQLDLLGKIRNVYYGYAVRLIVLTPSRSKLETTGTTISRTTAEITTLSSKAPPLNPAVITIKRIKRDTKNRKKRHVSGFGHIGHFAFENILDMLLRNNLGGPPLTQTDFTDFPS